MLLHTFSSRDKEGRIDLIVKVHEVLIQEGNTCLKTEVRDIPINSQSIIQMDLLDESIPVLLGLLSIRCQVEVEITHLTLIRSISIQDDLDISLL